MKTHKLTDLSSQIEQLIQDHIAAQRRAAEEALARAFEAATTSAAPMPKQSAHPRASAAAGRAPRRKRAEIQELSEQIWQAVAANPGETMALLAGKLGRRARDLQRPMELLRKAKRIRTAGQRHLTRYFPTCDGQAAAA